MFQQSQAFECVNKMLEIYLSKSVRYLYNLKIPAEYSSTDNTEILTIATGENY